MAKETKWTKGPWRIETDGYHISAGSYGVAAVFGSAGPLQAESAANARLIAKAPELAAMVAAFIAEATYEDNGDCDRFGDDRGVACSTCVLIDQARALLAAIDGQEG